MADESEKEKAQQAAYEVVSEPQQRKKYDAGLMFERDYEKHNEKRKDFIQEKFGWSPPVRCGFLVCQGTESLGRFTVEAILSWSEILNDRGESMVSFWPKSADHFQVEWL